MATITDKETREKAKKIIDLLPGEHCGKCGFENCGKFAVALAEGKAKPTGCRKSVNNIKQICEVLGIEAPSEQDLELIRQKHKHHHHHGHHHHDHHGHRKHRGGH